MKSINISELSEFDIEVKLKIILNDFYRNQTNLVESAIADCMKLIKENQDETILLPKNLKLTKSGQTLTFNSSKKGRSFIIPIMIVLFLAALIGTGYFGYQYYKSAYLDNPNNPKNQTVKIKYHNGEKLTITGSNKAEENKISKTFSVVNFSKEEAKYSLNWTIKENKFTSTNLKYNLITTSNSQISNITGATVPNTNSVLVDNVSIYAKDNHVYTIELYIDNIQSQDIGKKFNSRIELNLKA